MCSRTRGSVSVFKENVPIIFSQGKVAEKKHLTPVQAQFKSLTNTVRKEELRIDAAERKYKTNQGQFFSFL